MASPVVDSEIHAKDAATEIENPESAQQKAQPSGGKRLMGPDAVPGGSSIARFADPDGNVIGLTNDR